MTERCFEVKPITDSKYLFAVYYEGQHIKSFGYRSNAEAFAHARNVDLIEERMRLAIRANNALVLG